MTDGWLWRILLRTISTECGVWRRGGWALGRTWGLCGSTLQTSQVCPQREVQFWPKSSLFSARHRHAEPVLALSRISDQNSSLCAVLSGRHLPAMISLWLWKLRPEILKATYYPLLNVGSQVKQFSLCLSSDPPLWPPLHNLWFLTNKPHHPGKILLLAENHPLLNLRCCPEWQGEVFPRPTRDRFSWSSFGVLVRSLTAQTCSVAGLFTRLSDNMPGFVDAQCGVTPGGGDRELRPVWNVDPPVLTLVTLGSCSLTSLILSGPTCRTGC